MCVDPAKDCPAPASECVTAICDGAGLCAVKNVANGGAVTMQTAGDCKKVVCDGNGGTTSIDDNTDVNDDAKECTKDTCAAGAPVHTPVTVGTACGTPGGATKCDAVGACVGCITAADCGAAPACKVATCTAGACGTANAIDASPCNDSNACTQLDSCQAGVCTGGNPVVCTAADQCHNVGTCNTATGMCSNPVTGDGTGCNDNNACTGTDTCQAGICTGANPVVCMPLDQCHTAGSCNMATGTCSTPIVTNGTPCNDASACTSADTCVGGTCTGTPTVCMAQDACHTAGTCNAATGTCSNPLGGNGTACNDNDLCTVTDVCTAGACAGTPKVCTALDQCHVAGTCASATGACSNPNATDGTVCSIAGVPGTCTAGVCQ